MSITLGGTNPAVTSPDGTIQNTAGAVLQVVNATYNTQGSTASTSPVATGLSASITPKFSTSKILIIMSVAGMLKTSTNSCAGFSIAKNGSVLFRFEDAAGYTNAANTASASPATSYLDSPATTSAITYALYADVSFGAGPIYWNNYGTTAGYSASTITLMEIAA